MSVRPLTGNAENRVRKAFAVLVFSAIFLQKLGFSFGGGSSVGIDDFILWGVVVWLFVHEQAVIEPLRAFLFLSLIFSAMLSLYISGSVPSIPAFLVFLGMYATMLFVVIADERTVLGCMETYQKCMFFIALVVIGQQIVQYSIGNRYWPNLNQMLPNTILVDGYEYIRPYSWRSPYLVPNGVVFLEPSAVSGYVALSFAVEIVWFKRLTRLGVLSVALIVGMAGTGVATVALFAPWLFVQMGGRLRRWALSLGIPLIALAAASGAFSHYLERSSEFSRTNGSAYERFTMPLNDTIQVFSDPAYLLSGNGPGASPKGHDTLQWPVSKIGFEYRHPYGDRFSSLFVDRCTSHTDQPHTRVDGLDSASFFRRGLCDTYQHHVVSHVRLPDSYAIAVLSGHLQGWTGFRLRTAHIRRTGDHAASGENGSLAWIHPIMLPNHAPRSRVRPPWFSRPAGRYPGTDPAML